MNPVRLAGGLAIAACAAGGGPVPTGEPIHLVQVADGLDGPLLVTAPSGDARLFIVEQPGRIRIVRNDSLLPTAYLDITARVSSGGERGLLGLAFHPDFASNGFFYVDYTDNGGDTRVERFHADPASDVADPGSAHLILSVPQPHSNHNGGNVVFGPDAMLYVGLGDGGSEGDPQRNGQNPHTLLGTILRLDVDAADSYAIPPDNPFADGANGRPEIWAYGLRNPWRFSFDGPSGLLYVADVGQNAWEEINAEPAGRAGLNYGWNVMEGTHCYSASSCDRSGLVLPILEYGHSEGCSVTGGHVYRGSAVPDLVGWYVYADWCGGWIRALRYADGRVQDRRSLDAGSIGRITSFGVDGHGELYVTSGSGTVYRFSR